MPQAASPDNFLLPPGAKGRFAVVKLWPELKTAEDECIARLKIAAAGIGAECFEVSADGVRLDDPKERVGPDSVDFVLHLHYDTPKLYDAFSLVALWNPLQFYHEWGYQRTSRNLISHDDFVSCSSRAADDHVARLVRGTGTHLPAAFRLYHSLDQVVHPPSLGDFKLFYAGINWEAITGGKSRHQEVLRQLDPTGSLRIYGPQLFQGVKVWDGYRSYVREIPFDGISMVHEIHRAGLALVLSSQAHKDSELMSNRLFESVAAGALVICDENPFARRHFGDSLLYIDGRNSTEQMVADIQRHIDWARAEPDAALAKIARAQAIFESGFSLRRNLQELYGGLSARRSALDERQRGGSEAPLPVSLFLLMPQYDPAVLDRHLASLRVQVHADILPVLVVDTEQPADARAELMRRVAENPGLQLRQIAFAQVGLHGASTRRPIGAVLAELLDGLSTDGAVMFVAPNEHLFSNHVRVLANALVREPAAASAATAMILRYGDSPIHGVHDVIDFGYPSERQTMGFARFLFRTSSIDPDFGLALPYMDRKPLAVLAGRQAPLQLLPATLVVDALAPFPVAVGSETRENTVLADYCPEVFRRRDGPMAVPPHHGAPQAPVRLAGRVLRKLFNRRWLVGQLRAIRQRGLAARLQVLRRKLAS